MEKKKIFEILILLAVTLAFLFVFSGKNDINLIINNQDYLERSGYWDLTSAPILIDDTDPIRDWAYHAVNFDWWSGLGLINLI